MRGGDNRTGELFSYVDLEARVRRDHPLRAIRAMVNEALTALEADHEFLLAGDVFAEEMLEQWIAHKRDVEYYPVRNRPHPYEMQLYFDV